MKSLLSLVSLLALFSNASAMAQATGPSLVIPPGGTLRGHFTEEHTFQSGKAPMLSEGHFLIAPPVGIIWTIEKPLPITAVINVTGLSERLGNMPLPPISASRMPVLAQSTSLLASALTGNWPNLDREFMVSRQATPTGWEVKLTPRNQTDMPVQSIVADGQQFVTAATALRADGGRDNFMFSDQAISPAAPTPAEMQALMQADANGR